MNSSLVYLVQTDTTVGFSSSSDEKLNTLKKRDSNQKILQTIYNFKELNKHTRVPKKFRKLVRKSKKTTFIYPNKKAFRVVDKNSDYIEFLEKFRTVYSTSANITANSFNSEYAKSCADVIVFTKDGFTESNASRIYKISDKKIVKIR